jgi:low temperature requirement protein LtrA
LSEFRLHGRRVRGLQRQETAPLELFYDLVFVFAVTQVADLLLDDLSWAGAGDALLALLVVWWAWNYTTWVTSEVDPDPTPVRLLLLAMMLASLAMAVAVPEAFGRHGLLFAGSYIAIKIGRLAFLAFDMPGVSRRPGRLRRLLLWFVASGVFWIAGGVADGSARKGLWILALAIDLTGPLVMYWVPRRGRLSFGAWTPQTGHFVERFGLFMLIAFGETIVLTGAATSELDLTVSRFAGLTLAFLGTAAMWWLYFDDFPRVAKRRLELAPNPVQLARDAYMYLHVVLVAGVLLAAVGGELVIEAPTAELTDAEVAIRTAGPTLYLLGHVLYRLRLTGWVSWERLGGAAACVVVGLMGTAVPGLALAALLVSVLVSVVAAEQIRETRRLARGAPSRLELLEEPSDGLELSTATD